MQAVSQRVLLGSGSSGALLSEEIGVGPAKKTTGFCFFQTACSTWNKRPEEAEEAENWISVLEPVSQRRSEAGSISDMNDV